MASYALNFGTALKGYSGGAGIKPPPAPKSSRGARTGNINRVPRPGPKPNQKSPNGPNRGGRPQGSRTGNRGNRGGRTTIRITGGPRNTGFNSPLYDPTQVLSGKSLDQAAQGIADAQTVGPISELAKQIAANNQQTAGVQRQDFGYYMQMAKDAQDQVAREGLQAAALNQDLAGIGSATQTQLAQIGAQDRGGLNGRMAALGFGGDAAAQSQALQAQQQGVAAQNAQTFQQQGATQGSNYMQDAIAQAAATGLAGQQQLSNVALKGQQANEPLNAKIANLQASRGSLKATALGQLRTAERNYTIAQEGLGVKQQGLQETAANDAAKNALTLRNQNLTAQQNAILDKLRRLGYTVSVANNKRTTGTSAANNMRTTRTSAANTAARDRTSLAKGGSGSGTGNGKPLPPVSNNRVLAEISRIQQLIKDGQAKKVPGSQIRQNLQDGLNPSKQSYDSVLVDAAWELLGYGHLTPRTAAQLHSRGVRGGGYRVAPAPKPGGILGGIIGNA